MKAEKSAFRKTTEREGGGEGMKERGKLRDGTSRSERRLLLLNSGHSGSGSGMTLLGSAQHQRLIDPLKKCQHQDKACWRNKRTGEDGQSRSLPAGALSEVAAESSPST